MCTRTGMSVPIGNPFDVIERCTDAGEAVQPSGTLTCWLNCRVHGHWPTDDPVSTTEDEPVGAVADVASAPRLIRPSVPCASSDGGSSVGRVPHEPGVLDTMYSTDPPWLIVLHGTQLRVVECPLIAAVAM